MKTVTVVLGGGYEVGVAGDPAQRARDTPWYFPSVLPSRALSLMVPYLFAPRKASDMVGYLWPKFTFYAQTSAESY